MMCYSNFRLIKTAAHPFSCQHSVSHSAVKVVITNNVSMCVDNSQGDPVDGNEKAE